MRNHGYGPTAKWYRERAKKEASEAALSTMTRLALIGEVKRLKARVAEADAPHVRWEVGISAANGCVHCQEIVGGGRESGGVALAEDVARRAAALERDDVRECEG